MHGESGRAPTHSSALEGRAHAGAVHRPQTGLGRPCTWASGGAGGPAAWLGVACTHGAPAAKPGAHTGSQNLGRSPSEPWLTTGLAEERKTNFTESIHEITVQTTKPQRRGGEGI